MTTPRCDVLPAHPAMFAALAVPNFRRYVSGQSLSLTGTWVETVAQALLVLKLTYSGTILGLTTAARYAPILLLAPYAGLLVDRYAKRRVLLGTQIGLGLVSAALGAAVLTGDIRLWRVIVLAVLFGILSGMDNPARHGSSITYSWLIGALAPGRSRVVCHPTLGTTPRGRRLCARPIPPAVRWAGVLRMRAERVLEMTEMTRGRATRRTVLVSFAVDGAETLGLAVTAWVTGSVAVRAQTAANVAELAVDVFLFIGVHRSVHPPDETHPLGYGREDFFWSLFAALGIFVGGGVLGIDEAVHAALHRSTVGSYPVAYLVLVTTLVLDGYALQVALRAVREQAARHGGSLRYWLRRNTDPALTTNVVGGGCAVIGGVVAVAGLALTEVTDSAVPDTVAGGFIGLMLLVASVLLLGANRDLLSGRGVGPAMVSEISGIIAAQAGVVGVPDVFAVVVGPSSLIVDGDVTFADDLDVPAVEKTIMRCIAALRKRWPQIEYVYLTPVSKARPRRAV